MIDLKNTPFRLFYDESWKHEKAEYKTKEAEPWYHELRGPNATLSPISETEFEVFWIGKGSTALKRLATRVRQLDGEMIYFFSNNALQTVLDAVNFYKKRQVTDAMRESGKRLAARYGFKSHD